ncbi:MAG TPA: ABC transporter ATP-binding protein [Candidatus Sulfotelmatobacter sp.]|nr:ABC transporter ATP-binding protein [Candidatus Sulfotelmatobacter sp.]
MLEAVQLSKRYSSIPAVQDLSFTLRPGEVLGCLGPNGSGKSTTVKMLTGLLEPTRGRVRFDGRNIQDNLAEYRTHLGYVPEEAHLYPYLTGWEYLEMIGTLRGVPRPLLESKINAMLDLFSLRPARHAAMGTFSKGMRQRILLIASLMHDPEIFIFDEPLSGLDVTSALIFKNLVQALGRSGKMVFYCSHVLEVVEKVCTDVLILRQGTVIAHDSVANIGKILGASLENTFLHLVDDVDTVRVAGDIVDVMRAA